ncbi:LysR substrate-binding domain-containing protein [Paracoccus sulfuroxidans]|uniref:LysR family glycine cleavage system transcriptional activator n=1 Tax=Paracoccus sulfuroxidans TaxID=384678 RepID=A0A562NGK9_9RHOB|nr:LysR substrate-binding domain-containing protein [Paracoccus sulfuroxidans]TWI31234.1 LysR family glycine cleavage system transcriptional activator [Paracoccus sulfuroxidans]
MSKRPPLKALEAFDAFGRLGSVAEAADELGVTPGAVSQQLRKAEEALSLRLTERRGNALLLTSWGRIYHAEIRPAFEQLRQAQQKLDRLKSGGGIVISCLPSLAGKWLAPRLADWQMSHRDANVRLVGKGAEPMERVEGYDFRISYGDHIRKYDHFVELFTDWVVPVCSPDFLRDHPVATPNEILDHSLLGIEWDRNHRAAPTWSDWARHIGAEPRPHRGEMAFSLSSLAIDAAINGRGFVLAQISMVEDDLETGRLVSPFDLRMQLSQPYFLAWDRSALSKPFAGELRSWLIAISKSQRSLSMGPDVEDRSGPQAQRSLMHETWPL